MKDIERILSEIERRGPQGGDEAVWVQLARRRRDPAFMERLRRLVEEDRDILDDLDEAT